MAAFERMGSDNGNLSSSSDSTDSGRTPYTTKAIGELSVVAEFDDLTRCYRDLRSTKSETENNFINFVDQVKSLYRDYFQAVGECQRLQSLVDTITHECSDLENKLAKARKLIDQERLNTRNVKRERDALASQINHVRDLLSDNGASSQLPEDVRHKLSFLHSYSQPEWDLDMGHQPQLSAIKEVNSTGSILSDFSYSRSEDDLNGSTTQAGKVWKKHRPSMGNEPAIKKRRSSGNKVVEIGTSDMVRATTTLTMRKDGPITATSIIESVPKGPGVPESVPTNTESCPSLAPANLVFESWARESPRRPDQNLQGRQHCFQKKTVLMPDICTFCEKRIRFGKTFMKCTKCNAICHLECKDKLPLPCIPLINTPDRHIALRVIGDYTPTTPPMVPAILIHCINEIELRGLNEVGLYRVPGAERDVKALKERFLKGRGAPCLSKIDIHVICGTVKDFLRSLHEPIITYGLWANFVQAVQAKDPIDVSPALYQAISELPQPNRDTLAYMMLHLQKVSQAKECKMNVSNLAKVFGPTIVGYSSDNPNPNCLLEEMVQHNNVMEHLLNIPSDYWSTFIDVENNIQQPRLQQTPSTDSLLRPITKGYITPNRSMLKRKQKYFAFTSPKSPQI